MNVKEMEQPSAPWWQTLLMWVKDNVIIFMAFALAWKGIDKAFKYFSESRDDRIREIVKEEKKEIMDALDVLSKEFYSFRTHK